MARSDWTAHSGSLNLDGAHVRSGSSAVATPAANETEMVATWDQSASDSPAYGKFRSYFYFTGTGYLKIFFRRQDADNVYMVGVRSQYTSNVNLDKAAGGTTTTDVDSVPPDTGLTTDAWVGVGVYWWDVQGTLNVGVEIDENNDGSWSDNLARPLKDTSPDMPGGGGIGFGHNYVDNDMDSDFWADDSEVFY